MARKPVRREKIEKPAPARTVTEPGWADALERHGFWLAALVLAVLLAAFFSPLLFAGKTLLPPDQVSSLANKTFMAEAFAEPGSFLERYPLWSPYIFSGMPSYGSMIAAPYTNPTSLALWFLPLHVKLVAFYWLMGMMTWLLLKRLGMSAVAALLGAVAFVFTAHVITLIMFGHNTKIGTLIYLPLILLGTHELWKKPRVLWASVLALAVGNVMLASHLQIAYYTFLAAGLYLLLATIEGIRSRMGAGPILGRWGVWILCLGIGMAAGAILFYPVHEYAAHSIRGGSNGGLPYDYATNWSLHPLEMITFFVPSFIGFGGITYWGWMPFTDFPHYMGILVLFLAVLTVILWPRERVHRYFIVLGALSLLLAFGRHVPVFYNLMFDFFPYFNKFRVPSMILFLFQFSVGILAASGAARIAVYAEEDRDRIRKAFRWTGVGFVILIAVPGLIVAGGMLDDTLLQRLADRAIGYGYPGAQVAEFAARQVTVVRDMVAKDMLVVLAVLGAGFGLMLLRFRSWIPGVALLAGLFLLTVADLWHVDHRPATYYPRSDNQDSFAATSAVEFLQQQPGPYRILPLTGQGVTNNWFAYFKIPSILGYHPAKLKIYQDVIDEQGAVGITQQLVRGNFNIVNMLGMKYVVADQELTGGPLRTVHRGDQFVMENLSVLPRAWFVDRTRVIADPDRHLAALADSAWDPAETALLFEPIEGLAPGSGGSARVTHYGQRDIELEATAAARSLLVLSEVYYQPGWVARLDGEEVPIHRVDYLLRGVVVPPGTHQLTLRFDPPEFKAGVTISLGAYGLIVLGLIVGAFLERRSRTSSPGGSAAP